MTTRRLTRFDRAISEIERALSTVFDPTPVAERPSPAIGIDDVELDETQRRHAAGLMRVNHTGEVCAQALYSGQAAVARDEQTRAQLSARFPERIFPVLTPFVVDPAHPFPFLSNLSLNLAVELRDPEDARLRFVRVKVSI